VQDNARTLSEVFSTTSADGSVLGFVMSVIPDTNAPVLWIQDHMSQNESGRTYLPGLFFKQPVIHITLPRVAG
jgi:protein ImuA